MAGIKDVIRSRLEAFRCFVTIDLSLVRTLGSCGLMERRLPLVDEVSRERL